MKTLEQSAMKAKKQQQWTSQTKQQPGRHTGRGKMGREEGPAEKTEESAGQPAIPESQQRQF